MKAMIDVPVSEYRCCTGNQRARYYGTAARRVRLARLRREKRRAARLKRIRFILASTVLAVIISVSLSGFSMPHPEVSGTKLYTAVTVGRDQTLWDIAGSYYSDDFGSIQSMIREVSTLNHLDGSRIYYGQTLIIPYYSE